MTITLKIWFLIFTILGTVEHKPAFGYRIDSYEPSDSESWNPTYDDGFESFQDSQVLRTATENSHVEDHGTYDPDNPGTDDAFRGELYGEEHISEYTSVSTIRNYAPPHIDFKIDRNNLFNSHIDVTIHKSKEIIRHGKSVEIHGVNQEKRFEIHHEEHEKTYDEKKNDLHFRIM